MKQLVADLGFVAIGFSNELTYRSSCRPRSLSAALAHLQQRSNHMTGLSYEVNGKVNLKQQLAKAHRERRQPPRRARTDEPLGFISHLPPIQEAQHQLASAAPAPRNGAPRAVLQTAWAQRTTSPRVAPRLPSGLPSDQRQEPSQQLPPVWGSLPLDPRQEPPRQLPPAWGSPSGEHCEVSQRDLPTWRSLARQFRISAITRAYSQSPTTPFGPAPAPRVGVRPTNAVPRGGLLPSVSPLGASSSCAHPRPSAPSNVRTDQFNLRGAATEAARSWNAKVGNLYSNLNE